ncbi:long-chain-fatty-acid--CoA ligase [Luminiphilus syltensis NOR5-1B]|uniref:Long-chain-fatty-acid--CoA ligase n=1 Tax=Luminiphilus syltensis NOR5-1B TaxID=565045 RepID=B8KXL6_9GAMM|nr:AMP-binding protein [Luminiphilus syltensis]EED35435.1 long-chain-fatty-acid--CoA ligase [Luminiphilus syltensis NOR5-1B]
MNTSFADIANEKLRSLGVDTEIDLDQYGSIVELFEDAFTRHGDLPACTSLGHTLSYRDLDRLSANFAAWLQQRSGLNQGDRVAVQMPNLIQYLVVTLGVLRAGMVVVNTNPLYTERELQHQFSDAEVQLLVVQANVAQTASEVLPRTDVKQVIVTELADLHPQPKRFLINFIAKYVKKMVPPFSIPGALKLNDVLAAGAGEQYEVVECDRNSIAMLQYTGGTTGLAKGAMLSHRNLVSNVLQAHAVFSTHPIKATGDIFLQPLPVYHIYAFTSSMYALYVGAQTVFLPNPRDLSSVTAAFQQYQPKMFFGLNTLFVALSNDPDFQQLDFSSLKVTLSGGMALTEAAAKRWEQITGCPVSEGYGLTETSPVATSNPGGAQQLGTIGLPMPHTELKVIDDTGAELGLDTPGELCIRGPQVMLGYWKRPEATAEVLDDDGWFATGDVAVMQADGYSRIVDRIKDMIVVSGFNVYPNELEDVITRHPGVLECAVIGVPDDSSGEAIKLFVVKADPALTEAEIKAHCREHLTGYKIPKQIEFRDELPKSNVGKILRRELRDAEVS